MQKSFNSPDEVKVFPKTKIETIKIGNSTLIRNTFEPGWRWSECVGSAVGSDRCQVHHLLYIISGHFKVAIDNGTDVEAVAGDVVDVPPGHDGWVVGDEPVVSLDMVGLTE